MTIRSFIASLLATTTLWALVGLPASAQTTPAGSAPQPTQLDTVTSTMTRIKRPIDAVPGSVTVVTDEDIDRENKNTIRDLVRNEPGVNVQNQPGRGGLTNFIIRGIGGNRVLVMVDGLRSPDFPGSNIGAGNYNRDYFDLENVKRVEIVRGPASALYGSDALGGVIAYYTKDPSDYLIAGGRNYYASVKAGYSSADESQGETFTAAARFEGWEILGIYTRRDGHNTKLGGSIYEANPQNWFENDFFGKLVFRPGSDDVIRIVGEAYDKQVKTHVLSGVGITPSIFARIWDEWGFDRTQRYRISAEWEHTAPIGFIDRFKAIAYWIGVNRHEDTTTLRGTLAGAIPTNFRYQTNMFAQDVFGAEVQFETKATIFDAENYFTYGLQFSHSTSTRPRVRTQITLATGVSSPTVAGEISPTKNYPDSTITQLGAYVQDEIVAGRLTAVPAVRIDWYALQPYPDSSYLRSLISQAGFPGAGTAVADFSSVPKYTSYVSVSPKMGLIYRLTDEYSAYGQYGRGFRAPPYDSGQFGFNNSGSGYQILPNANLRPETVDGFEIGARGKYRSGSSWQVAAFYNVYKDFIETVQTGTSAGGTILFQYQNLPQVEIWGIEARGEYRFSEAWALAGWAAWARGVDVSNGQPIDSVDPWKIQGRVRYGREEGFGAQLIGTYIGKHDQVSVPNGITCCSPGSYPFQTPAVFLLDATLSYAWNPHLKVNFGAFNITDEKWWNSQDVVGRQTVDAQLDRFTQPGRYFGVNLTAKW